MRFVTIPGLGGDRRMHQRLALPGPRLDLDWPQSISDLPALAAGWAPLLSADDVLVGSSLGGMVALELHRLIGCRVVLLGSALERREINRLALALVPLARVAPWRGMQALAAVANHLPHPKRLEFMMFADQDPARLRALIRALAAWDGYQGSPAGIHRIHGRWDPLIPVRPWATYDRLVNAAHLIALEAPETVSAAIAGWFPQHLTADRGGRALHGQARDDDRPPTP